MDRKTKLDLIYARMFTEEVLDKLLDVYHRDANFVSVTEAEKEYVRAKAVLAERLNDAQKRALDDIEAAARRNIRRAMGFAFSRGSAAGFRDAPAPVKPDCPYLRTASELVTEAERSCPSYNAGRRHLRELYEDLYGQLDFDTQDFLVSVDVLWDERLLGIFLLCYEMGYNQAFSAAGQTGRMG